MKSIIEHPGESRKEWMVEIFKRAGPLPLTVLSALVVCLLLPLGARLSYRLAQASACAIRKKIFITRSLSSRTISVSAFKQILYLSLKMISPHYNYTGHRNSSELVGEDSRHRAE